MKIKRRKEYIISLVLLSILLFPLPLMAQKPLADAKSGSVTFAGCIPGGDCTLNHFLLIGVWAAQFIIGITGSLVMLFFIYGGFLFLTSGGNRERVEKGKQVIKGALIGMALVFGGYLIINYVISDLLGAGSGWNVAGWFK